MNRTNERAGETDEITDGMNEIVDRNDQNLIGRVNEVMDGKNGGVDRLDEK